MKAWTTALPLSTNKDGHWMELPQLVITRAADDSNLVSDG